MKKIVMFSTVFLMSAWALAGSSSVSMNDINGVRTVEISYSGNKFTGLITAISSLNQGPKAQLNCVNNPNVNRSCVVGGLALGTGFSSIENTKEKVFKQLIEGITFVTQVPWVNNESQSASIECREDGHNQTCIISQLETP